jgi:hypothetical protein
MKNCRSMPGCTDSCFADPIKDDGLRLSSMYCSIEQCTVGWDDTRQDVLQGRGTRDGVEGPRPLAPAHERGTGFKFCGIVRDLHNHYPSDHHPRHFPSQHFFSQHRPSQHYPSQHYPTACTLHRPGQVINEVKVFFILTV